MLNAATHAYLLLVILSVTQLSLYDSRLVIAQNDVKIIIKYTPPPPHLPSQSINAQRNIRIDPNTRIEAVNAANFTMTIYPLSQTICIGQQANYQIALNSTNGFIGQVTLNTENFSPELIKGFSASTVNLQPNSTINSTLTVNAINVGEETFYPFVVTGTSGNITKRISIDLTVKPQCPAPSLASYAFLGAVLLFAAFVVWYGVRNRRTHPAAAPVQSEPKPPQI